MKYKIDYVIKGSVIMDGNHYNFMGVTNNSEARREVVKIETEGAIEGIMEDAQEQTPELTVTELPE